MGKSHAALKDVEGMHIERAEVSCAAEDVEDKSLNIQRGEARESKMMDEVGSGEWRVGNKAFHERDGDVGGVDVEPWPQTEDDAMMEVARTVHVPSLVDEHGGGEGATWVDEIEDIGDELLWKAVHWEMAGLAWRKGWRTRTATGLEGVRFIGMTEYRAP